MLTDILAPAKKPTERPIPAALDIAAMRRNSLGKVRWLWEGYVAFGSITLLTSRWKAGKTTLLSLLLSRLNGGGTLAGSTVADAPALVVSEEDADIWVARSGKSAFGPNVKWHNRPFLSRPNLKRYFDLLHKIRDQDDIQRKLIVIDPLATHFPEMAEHSSKILTSSLTGLRILASKGFAILILHHPRKDHAIEPRGSGILTGFVDILMELDTNYVGPVANRRRWLRAKGRHDGIPAERLIELNEAGNDYIVCNPTAEECADGWSVIRWVLADANKKYTRDEILEYWPEQRDKPHRNTLWTWLETARAEGRLRRDGLGRKHNAFRYWLSEREEHFGGELEFEPVPELGAME